MHPGSGENNCGAIFLKNLVCIISQLRKIESSKLLLLPLIIGGVNMGVELIYEDTKLCNPLTWNNRQKTNKTNEMSDTKHTFE